MAWFDQFAIFENLDILKLVAMVGAAIVSSLFHVCSAH